MVNRYLLLVLLTKLRLFNFETVALQKQILTRELDLSKLIEFPYEQQCLQIALDVKHQPRFSLVVPDNIPILVRSHLSLQLRDIGTEQEGQCQTFLIFAENIEIVKQIFKPDQTRAKQFFPFTKIYFHLDNPRNYTSNLESMSLARKFLTENALFGYVFEFNDGGNESKVSVKDLLTNDVISPVASYIPKDLLHPFVNTALVKDNFRISSFNCSPYNTYPASSNEKTLIDGMDGTEFRLVREVTRNWKKTFKFRDFSKVKSNPYVSILLDLSNKSSDISFCALWLIEDIYKQFDLSTFYEEQCLLLVVPKPRKLHEATAIYTTLDRSVWLLFLFFFLLATTLLNAIAKAEKRLNESNSIFTDLTNTVMEAISTATSHSVVHFPTDQTSVKILLTSAAITFELLITREVKCMIDPTISLRNGGYRAVARRYKSESTKCYVK